MKMIRCLSRVKSSFFMPSVIITFCPDICRTSGIDRDGSSIKIKEIIVYMGYM